MALQPAGGPQTGETKRLKSFDILRFAAPLAACCASFPALAQVTVDPRALDSLHASPPAHTATRAQHPAAHKAERAHRSTAHHPAPAAKREAEPGKPVEPKPETATVKPEAAPPSEPKGTAAPAPGRNAGLQSLPMLPAAPPPAPSLAPPAPPMPVHAPTPPPPIPVIADAPGAASEIHGGLRVTFGAGRSELNPATVAAIRAFAQQQRNGKLPITVLATATGSPDDPSTPRRLSLSRALAARAVLITEGIPSTRIFVHAAGPNAGDGPADRVDLTEQAATASASAPAGPPPGAAQAGTGQAR